MAGSANKAMSAAQIKKSCSGHMQEVHHQKKWQNLTKKYGQANASKIAAASKKT